MRLQFVALVRKKSGTYHARKGIPIDVRDAYARLYGVRWEAKLILPASTSPADAKKLYGEWFADIETRIATLRAEARGEGRPLTHRDAVALCGEWRRWFVAKHEGDAPGKPSYWRNLSDTYFWEILMREAPEEFRADPNSDPDWEWMKSPEVAAELRPVIAEAAQTALLLTSRGLALNATATAAFIDGVQGDFPEVLNLLERRARGDYSPDEALDVYPKFEMTPAAHVGAQVSPWGLFEAWVKAAKPAAGTVGRWNTVLLALTEKYPNAAGLTSNEARAWINGLITEKRSARTVSDVWLPAVRRVFAWAVEQALIGSNPFTDIRVTIPKQARTRETDAFTDEEAQIILRAASAIGKPTSTFDGAKRWVFWIAAYTGARAGEITQLRGIDIQKRGEAYFALLTPDAGTIKTGEPRTVPLHEHLVTQGFLEFVKSRGEGPLFYNPQRDAPQQNALKPRLSRAAKTRQRLGTWVRELGVTDAELSPTHAWRDTFKLKARRAGIEEHMHDYITGHAPASIGRSYGAPTRDDMAKAMKRFPRYVV